MAASLRRRGFCLYAFALARLQAEGRTFGSKDLLSELLHRNAEIPAARSPFEAATKRPSQLCALPERTVGYANFGPGNPFSRINASEFVYQGFGVSQKLPFAGKLSLASEEAKRKGESVQPNFGALRQKFESNLRGIHDRSTN